MADYFSFRPRRSTQILFLLLMIGLISAIETRDCAAQVYYRVTPAFYPKTPRYYPFAIARPQDRSWIRSLPMEQRPIRPLHFYGNRVRQSYYVQPSGYNFQRRVQTYPTRARQFRL